MDSNPPVRVGATILNSEEEYLISAVIDPVDGYAYFGTNSVQGRVIKIELGNGSNPPSRVDTVILTEEAGLSVLRSIPRTGMRISVFADI